MAVSGSGTLMITGECIKLASVSANGENPDEYTCPAHFYWPRETSSARQVPCFSCTPYQFEGVLKAHFLYDTSAGLDTHITTY